MQMGTLATLILTNSFSFGLNNTYSWSPSPPKNIMWLLHQWLGYGTSPDMGGCVLSKDSQSHDNAGLKGLLQAINSCSKSYQQSHLLLTQLSQETPILSRNFGIPSTCFILPGMNKFNQLALLPQQITLHCSSHPFTSSLHSSVEKTANGDQTYWN